MLSFIGYNLFSDNNTLDPMVLNCENITRTHIENAIFEDVYISNDTTVQPTTPPLNWNSDTILYAKFENSINAGNIDYQIRNLRKVRIKRREVGTFEWIPIFEKDIRPNTPDDLSFTIEDYLNKDDTLYEYAFIPLIEDSERGLIEGDYVTSQILSKFNGVFITDSTINYKAEANVSYGDMQQNQKVNLFEPYGRKYPIYVSNALTNYKTGSMSGTIIGTYMNTGVFNRQEMVKERELLLKFLNNKKAKIIKDNMGNYFVCMVIDSPNVSFDQNWGNGMMQLSFNWAEICDENDINGLQEAGLIPTM